VAIASACSFSTARLRGGSSTSASAALAAQRIADTAPLNPCVSATGSAAPPCSASAMRVVEMVERIASPSDPPTCCVVLSKHGLAALQLRRHRGKGGQSGSSELTSYPDGVQARRCGHVISLQPDLVSLRRQDLVIVRPTWLALLWGCFVTPGRKEPQLACALNGARAIARAELGVDLADVRVDRVDGHVELSRDLGPRQICR
jgi:hypothetical protein